jgi:hypothetical protein
MNDYKFATDGEMGIIEAANFESAKDQLEAMVADTDGGSGWVEDLDGDRYEIEA